MHLRGQMELTVELLTSSEAAAAEGRAATRWWHRASDDGEGSFHSLSSTSFSWRMMRFSRREM